MTKTANIEAQEELAFDLLDDLLERATWKIGTVIIKTSRTVIFCYDLPKLRKDLLEVATAAVNAKYKQCDANLTDVVQNIIEEYSAELKRFRIFERSLPRHLKKAQ